jgi:hypothetical protein
VEGSTSRLTCLPFTEKAVMVFILLSLGLRREPGMYAAEEPLREINIAV